MTAAAQASVRPARRERCAGRSIPAAPPFLRNSGWANGCSTPTATLAPPSCGHWIWFSLRAVTRPLAALGRAARAIGAGDLSHPVPVTGARAFTRLAVDMEVMRRALAAQRATPGASDARLHALVTHLPVILFALDANGIVTLYEGRGLAPLGVTPDAVVGRSYRDVYAGHPEIVEPLCQALNGVPVSFLTTVSGLTFDARATPLRDPAGRVT